MKKFLSIRKVTTMLAMMDIEFYMAALKDSAKRMDFIRTSDEIVTISDNKEEIIFLLDVMIEMLYQKAKIRKALLEKIEYSIKTYVNENSTVTASTEGS